MKLNKQIAMLDALIGFLVLYEADLTYTTDDDGIHLRVKGKDIATFWGVDDLRREVGRLGRFTDRIEKTGNNLPNPTWMTVRYPTDRRGVIITEVPGTPIAWHYRKPRIRK